MKIKQKLALSLLVAFAFVSATAIAGGCLQGTWQYYDASGRLVGEQTVGCGELDGTWGAVTSRSTFTQGCASSF
jgi:Family of unknown function (DUF6289)